MHVVHDLYLCKSTSGLHHCRGHQRIIKSGLFKLMQAGCNPYQELAPLDCFVHAGQYSKLCKCCNNLSTVHTSSSRVVMLHNCLYVRIVIWLGQWLVVTFVKIKTVYVLYTVQTMCNFGLVVSNSLVFFNTQSHFGGLQPTVQLLDYVTTDAFSSLYKIGLVQTLDA